MTNQGQFDQFDRIMLEGLGSKTKYIYMLGYFVADTNYDRFCLQNDPFDGTISMGLMR